MIYGLILILVGVLSWYLSYKRYLKEKWEDLYDKTNVYGGMFIGVVAFIFGIVILLKEYL